MMFVQPSGSRNLRGRILSTMLIGAATVLAFFNSSVPAHAAIRARVEFDSADVRIEGDASAPRVLLRGANVAGGEDAPALPMVIKTFYIPENEEVAEVLVHASREERLATGVQLRTRTSRAVEPAEVTRPYPTGALAPDAQRVPAQDGMSLGGGSAAGFMLHSVALFPVRWNNRTGELTMAREMDVEIVTRPRSTTSDLVRLREVPAARHAMAQGLAGIVENAIDLPMRELAVERADEDGGFNPRDLPSVDGSGVDMVIVTTAALSANFQTLATWKTKKGVPSVVRTIDWIETNYPQGHDLPERIRLFLKDAYQKWGAQYALLAGDYPQVPPREAFNRFFFSGSYIPSDQYYACLEGDWNADGDAVLGEGQWHGDMNDLTDLYPDLFVGRAPVQSAAEANNFVTKTLTYEKTPPANYVRVHGALAEVLFPPEWEFGDPPENIALDGKTLVEALDTIVDPTWTRQKRYQSDNNLDRTIALNQLTNGRHLLTIFGHGDAFKFSVGNGTNPLVYVADTDTTHNGNKLMYVVATACNPNQFDLECQGESFMNNPGSGAVAVSGPSRADFPLSASDFGVAMYELVFQNGVVGFGAMNQLKRVPFVPLSQTDSTPDRWTMLTSTLFGDPETRFWTNEPASLVVTHPGSIPLGTASITVTVTNGAAVPQADALVCVSDASGTYSRGRTNGSGQAVLPITSSQNGTLAVVASKRDFKPYEGSTTITTGAGPVIALTSSTIDDDGTLPSIGNGDGRIDAGERVEFDLAVRNGGNATANSVSIAAAVLAGSEATVNVTYGGVADPTKVFIGKNRQNPGAIPFTLDFGTPTIDYQGKPAFTFGADSTSGDHGVFLWQDDEGWHLNWGSAEDSTQVAGTISTDGKVLSTSGLDLENGLDALSVNGPATQITFSGWTHRRDLSDGFDFALADDTKLSMFTASDPLGNIAAGGSTVGTVVADVDATARGGQVGYLSLTITASNGGPWTDVVPIVFAGPSLESYVHVVNDGTPPASGDGDKTPEVGETVQILTTVLNRGNGAAVSVDGSLTGGAGITIVDGADAYGDIAPLAQDPGTNGYLFTITSGAGTSVTLTLTDSQGRMTFKVIDFLAPAVPTGLTFDSTPTEITLTWNKSPELDLAGYKAYRSALIGGPYNPIAFELLRGGARFVDDGLALGTTFYYKVSAVDMSGNESLQSAPLQAWTTVAQLGGWPTTANNNVFGGLVMADADDDGEGELYVSSKDFNFYAFNSDASTRLGFPINTSAEMWSGGALADLDKDGDLEVMFGSNDTRFYVQNHDGTKFFGGVDPWFIDLPGVGEEIRSTATIADVDRDSQLEFFFGSNLGKLYAFNHDGTPQVAGSGLLFTAPGTQHIWGTCAIADLANDGTREIAFTCWNDSLYVITPTGARVTGFPKGAANDFKRGPVIGDLDNDGTMEILASNFDTNVYAYNHNGTNYLSGGIFADLPAAVIGAPALANLDGDPQLEVVVATSSPDGKVYAFNHDGSGFLAPGGLFAFPDPTAQGTLQSITATPIIVNVDGDSDFEIFFGHLNGKFYGYHHTGVLMSGFPVSTDLEIYSTAAAGDLDGNGDIEIAFASFDGSVNVLDFSGPATPANMPWPMEGQNPARTAVYGELGPWQTGSGDLASIITAFALEPNMPNPFARSTTIRFASPRETPVVLRIFDVSGRAVRTLINGSIPAGRHSFTWDGRDDGGRETSAGVYFVRLEGDQKMLTQKTIRVR